VTAPSAPTRAAVAHLLFTLRKALGQLESLGDLKGERLAADPSAGLVIERILSQLAELAYTVNGAAAGTPVHRDPYAFTGLFAGTVHAARAAGLVDAELAARLLPDDAPHHVALQLTLDVDPEAAAAVVADGVATYREYIRQVAAWVGP
jgi:hypothetical protein